jgi:hypothetical protein
MSLRHRIPAPLHELSRDSYLALGARTARWRLSPDFLMIGASRCGTTSLFRALSAHPHILRPAVNKGVRYFDLNYHRGWKWYQGHFPLRSTAVRHANGHPPRTFEASGYYLFHPLVPARIGADLPQVRLIAMLRDPVERAYSAWKHETARGFEDEPFERALELEADRLAGEADRLLADPQYASFGLRHRSHRTRGEYADQLERFLRYFPRSQLHIVQSEAFFAEPHIEYARVLDFLHLPQHDPGGFAVHNARPSSPLPDRIRRDLQAHYAPFNHRLSAIVGEPLRWD